jgi:hypothetical protein
MRTIRLLFTFYKSFAFASLLITMACLSITYNSGLSAFAVLFWFKIITYSLIFAYLHSYKKDMYYYYKNLGLSKKHLWVSTLSFDLILFLLLITLTIKIR